MQMDQVTQQNAALVEEMAAAASSLKSQAQDLVQVVAVFKLAPGDEATRAFAHAPRSKPPMRAPALAAAPGRAAIAAPQRAAIAAPKKPAALPAKAKALAAPARAKPAPAPAKAGGDDDWETF
jgi:hypothetical protein